MSRRTTVEHVVTRDEDFENLEQLRIAIDRVQEQEAVLMDERRLIWQRRLDTKDSTKAQLARASGCHGMNVTQGLKPEFVAKARERFGQK